MGPRHDGRMKRLQCTRPCAFCPATANITGDHLWSDWTNDLLGPRTYQFTMKKRDGEVRRFEKDEINLKANVVCGDCNHGWMSQIENRTKTVTAGMIKDGAQVSLDDAAVLTIAQFGFLKSVIADHMHEREPFYSTDQRYSFRDWLSVPEGVRVWLARTASYRGLFKSTNIEVPPGTPNRFELNTLTYGIGHFVIQVVGSRWKKKALRRHANPPQISQHVGWARFAVSIWPDHASPVVWPPSGNLSLDIEEPFILRCGKLVSGRSIGIGLPRSV